MTKRNEKFNLFKLIPIVIYVAILVVCVAIFIRLDVISSEVEEIQADTSIKDALERWERFEQTHKPRSVNEILGLGRE